MSVEIGPPVSPAKPAEERPAGARQPRVSTTEQLDLERERSRERVRTLLTSSIVGVYLVSVLLVVVGAGLKIVDITLAKEINSTFLTPLLGIAGGVVGFYFGSSILKDIKGK